VSIAPADGRNAVSLRAGPPGDAHDLQGAINASLAPLIRKIQELEARIEYEAAERKRLRDDLLNLQLANTRTAAPNVDPVPDVFDGSRRNRTIKLGILIGIGLLLAALLTATLLSQSR
jgi:hypothetical protein